MEAFTRVGKILAVGLSIVGISGLVIFVAAVIATLVFAPAIRALGTTKHDLSTDEGRKAFDNDSSGIAIAITVSICCISTFFTFLYESPSYDGGITFTNALQSAANGTLTALILIAIVGGTVLLCMKLCGGSIDIKSDETEAEVELGEAGEHLLPDVHASDVDQTGIDRDDLTSTTTATANSEAAEIENEKQLHGTEYCKNCSAVN